MQVVQAPESGNMKCPVCSSMLGAWQFCTLVPSLMIGYGYFPEVPQALSAVEGTVSPLIIQAVLFIN